MYSIGLLHMTNRERLGKRLCVAFLALYALLFAFNSFTRTREFEDGDTMNFIDVARHIAAGQGVTRSGSINLTSMPMMRFPLL